MQLIFENTFLIFSVTQFTCPQKNNTHITLEIFEIHLTLAFY